MSTSIVLRSCGCRISRTRGKLGKQAIVFPSLLKRKSSRKIAFRVMIHALEQECIESLEPWNAIEIHVTGLPPDTRCSIVDLEQAQLNSLSSQKATGPGIQY